MSKKSHYNRKSGKNTVNLGHRRMSLLSENREIEIPISNSKFDGKYYEKFKKFNHAFRQKQNAVRGKRTVLCTNQCAWRDLGFVVQHPFPSSMAQTEILCVRDGEHEKGILIQKAEIKRRVRNHIVNLRKKNCQKKFEIKIRQLNQHSSQQEENNKLFQKKVLQRSEVEICAERIIWECNKRILFSEFSKTVYNLEKERTESQILCRTKEEKLRTRKKEEDEVNVTTYANLDIEAIASIQQARLQKLEMLLGHGSGPPRKSSSGTTIPGGGDTSGKKKTPPKFKLDESNVTPPKTGGELVSGVGTSKIPTPQPKITTMGQSPSVTNTVAAEAKSTDEMDKLLAEASRLHLVETDRSHAMKVASLRSPESIAVDLAMDTTPAEEEDLVKVKRVQLREIQNTMEEALEWLDSFERDRVRFFPTNPDGDVIIMNTVLQLKQLYANVQEAFCLGDTHNLWYKIIPILIQTNVLIGDVVNRMNYMAGNSSVFTNAMSKTMHLMHEQVKLVQVPYDVSHPEAVDDRPTRLDYDQLSEGFQKKFDSISFSVGRDGVQNDPLCLSKIRSSFVLP